MPEPGTFFWHELVTTDPASSEDFYSRLLGWSGRHVDAGPFGTYTLFERSGRPVAGMMKPTIDYTRARTPAWYTYIAVDDVDACAARVPALGGTIIDPPRDIPGVGRVCMLADPTGAAVRLMKPVSEGQVQQVRA